MKHITDAYVIYSYPEIISSRYTPVICEWRYIRSSTSADDDCLAALHMLGKCDLVAFFFGLAAGLDFAAAKIVAVPVMLLDSETKEQVKILKH